MRKTLIINGTDVNYRILAQSEGKISFELNGKEYRFNRDHFYEDNLWLVHENKRYKVRTKKFSRETHIDVDTHQLLVKKKDRKMGEKSRDDDRTMLSPMPGKVLKILVDIGEEVSKGSPLLVLEAMKMEHTLSSTKDGIVEQILHQEGEVVEGGVEIIKVKGNDEA